jgi:tRNA (guanine-N7-)-methyltransferase
MKSLENVFQPGFNEIYQKDFYLKGNWAKEFFKNENPLIIELGCGKGEYTTGLAELNPDKNFIGIDIKGARIYKGAITAIDKNLKNVAFIRTSIEPIHSFFSENEVSEIWLTFSDPQPNKPKKRLSSSVFLNKYMNIIKPGALIHLKTDNQLLYDYTYALVKENNFKILRESNDIYSDKNLPFEVKKIQTFYEKKFITMEKKINYLEFMIERKVQVAEPINYDKFKISNYTL